MGITLWAGNNVTSEARWKFKRNKAIST